MGNGVFSELEKMAPGSVRASKDGGSVTLIGWHLEEFDYPDDDKCKPSNIESDSWQVRVPWAPGNLSFRPVEGVKHQRLLIRVIYPLSKAPKESTGRNTCSCGGGISGKQTCPVQEKNKSSYDDYHLVPVVKRKLNQRILHSIYRIFQKLSRDFKHIQKRGKHG